MRPRGPKCLRRLKMTCQSTTDCLPMGHKCHLKYLCFFQITCLLLSIHLFCSIFSYPFLHFLENPAFLIPKFKPLIHNFFYLTMYTFGHFFKIYTLPTSKMHYHSFSSFALFFSSLLRNTSLMLGNNLSSSGMGY